VPAKFLKRQLATVYSHDRADFGEILQRQDAVLVLHVTLVEFFETEVCLTIDYAK